MFKNLNTSIQHSRRLFVQPTKFPLFHYPTSVCCTTPSFKLSLPLTTTSSFPKPLLFFSCLSFRNMSTLQKKELPSWAPVAPTSPSTGLSIKNSLTKTKVPFVPMNRNTVTWYGCGPTVYDASHLGHARNYVTFDYIRRIMESYFGYNMNIAMNITDIDDKIILRGRQAHLFSQKLKKTTYLDLELFSEVVQAWKEFIVARLNLAADHFNNENYESWKEQLLISQAKNLGLETDPKFSMHLSIASKGLVSIINASSQLAQRNCTTQAALDLLNGNEDIISIYLDKLYGASVTDPSVFLDLTQYWENDFMQDMDSLNVLKPDILLRVTEFIPEIISFVEKIISNGYAYESNGSVYFSVSSFDGVNGHYYAKLEPNSKGNQSLVDEGEGSLGTKLAGKNNQADFALWKASKPGEPAWDSPWGKGRPGWHIECSVMASEVFGEKIDIHTGGIDLTFPHHDNELAQSEAHFENHQWINYFMHTGHLHIEGSKMSKSLKNFITIKEALQKYTSRQLRLCFLLQKWDAPFDFKASSMEESISTEATITNFFAIAEDMQRRWNSGNNVFGPGGVRTFKKEEIALVSEFNQTESKIHSALCDSFDTPNAMKNILSLINKTNIYIRNKPNSQVENPSAVFMVAKYISKILRIFGLSDPKAKPSQIGWNATSGSSMQTDSTLAMDNERVVMPYLDIISKFRDSIRSIAKEKEINKGEILKACDDIRDNQLPKFGVLLDDREGDSLIKFVDPKNIAQEAEKKAKIAQEKKIEKQALQEANLKKKLARLEAGKVPPSELFKTGENAAKYCEWDSEGIPTKSIDGELIAKNKSKKLLKEYEAQKKLHNEYLKSLETA
ncbi:hypothetical protein BB561_004213 [Smittium simulii]|uniref:cysteine--tRNA ligase n=1 Tax=Smittium simulii TaxID=133385 RepID=A0A2T9YHF6_9FUNG|nr:hypothetical protein BB561_004213 [Smittium simulii]